MAFDKRSAFKQYLLEEERGEGTIEKYLRDVNAFLAWLGEQEISKLLFAGWKEGKTMNINNEYVKMPAI